MSSSTSLWSAKSKRTFAKHIGAVVAPIGNIFIALIKNTALALTISVMELGFVSSKLITDTAQPVVVLLGVTACYLALALTAGWLFSVLEHRVAMKR